jgi:phospholipase C
MTTIGDLLSASGISWAWYSGGWNAAVAGKPDPLFQFHHQPFAYFANYKDGTPARADHLKDEVDFVAAIQSGTLPAVSFFKPIGEDNEHPGYTDLASGELHILQLISAIQAGPQWKDTALIITYDENGGQWDHLAPPKRDPWGPGTRVPTLIISPYARKRYVDKTTYDTLSIMATIEHRFQLGSTGGPDAKAQDLTPAFDFTQTP